MPACLHYINSIGSKFSSRQQEIEMNMIQVVTARTNLGAILSGYNVPESALPVLMQAHDALLAYERTHPKEQAEAFAAIAGPREKWEIA